EERPDDAVLAGGPYRAVSSEERLACAPPAHESETPFEQSVDEPLEPDRHFEEAPSRTGGDAVDHAARHDGLSKRRVRWPRRPLRKQVVRARREVVIRRQQPGALRDDAVTIVIGIAGECDVE